ncbi:MAG TPA: alpha/beta hydrolase family protein [Chitinophaga sp.]|uniref:alpha/beta hydrolase n=1 Tax=Chitinophaga sp. TaxID=1869181 RepID=UPI002B535938|nr:alpha/beta hydrolase family protein [Chitinophaga sp.]HVI47303.1 alpha/beta hydrolase family protein [Chitinophaga sp.]
MKIRLTVVLLLLFVAVSYAQTGRAPVYVLVHGAWHGGWCWQKVSTKLRSQGSIVYTPTLGGLGEYKDVPHEGINLDTHISEIVNLLEMEDLHDVVLVGHSYGGLVIAGVADRIPERLSKLVFLDAMLADNGQSLLSLLPAEGQASFAKTAEPYKMVSAPSLPLEAFGLGKELQPWVAKRITLQPYKTLTQPLVLKHPFGNHLPLVYIACTKPQAPFFKTFSEKAKASPDWKYYELVTGHDAMLTAPDDLTSLLTSIAK